MIMKCVFLKTVILNLFLLSLFVNARMKFKNCKFLKTGKEELKEWRGIIRTQYVWILDMRELEAFTSDTNLEGYLLTVS